MRHGRRTERGRGAGIAPRVVRLLRLPPVAFGLQRADVGGMALKCLAGAVGLAEGLFEHRVGRLIGRRELALVALAFQPHEGAVDALGPAERPSGVRVDRRARDRAGRHPVAAFGLVLLGHPCITLYLIAASSRREPALDFASTLPALAPVADGVISKLSLISVAGLDLRSILRNLRQQAK